MSSRRKVYLFFTVVGFVIPNLLFLTYIRASDWYIDPDAVVTTLTGNRLVLAFVADLAIACVVFFYWMWKESKKYGISRAWLFVVLTVMFGLSFTYPLFLYVRQKRREHIKAHQAPGHYSARSESSRE